MESQVRGGSQRPGEVPFSLVNRRHGEGERGCAQLTELALEPQFSSWVLASRPSSSVTQRELLRFHSTLRLLPENDSASLVGLL